MAVVRMTKQRLRGNGKLFIRKSKDEQFYFVLVAGNGESIATSETYTRKTDAIRAAERFVELVTCAAIIDEA